MPPPNKRAKFEANAQEVLDYLEGLEREYEILCFDHTDTSIRIRYLEAGTDKELIMVSLDDRTAVADFIFELATYDGMK